MAEGVCHFGCCAACRCPLPPGTDKIRSPDNYAVYVVDGWFKEMTARSRLSSLTGPMQMSHVVSRAHTRDALTFWLEWAAQDSRSRFRIKSDLDGWNAADFNAIPYPPTGPPTTIRVFYADPGRWGTVDAEKGVTSEYKAAWLAASVSPLSFPEFTAWLKAVPASRSFHVAFEPDLTYPCCTPCNLLMDMKPRLRELLRSDAAGPADLVPYKGVKIFKLRKRLGAVAPELMPADDKKADKAVIGALIAFYLHRCLRGIPATPGATANANPTLVHPAQRNSVALHLYILHAWFALIVTAACMERLNPIAVDKKTPRGDHNFLGVATLFIAQWMHMCLRYQMGPDAMGFFRFYTLYFLEMCHCAPNVAAPADERGWWDAKTFPTVVDFIGQDLTLHATRAEAVQHVATRLSQLYSAYIRPIAMCMAGKVQVPRDVTPAMDSATWAQVRSFFVTKPQATALMQRHNECQLFSPQGDQQDLAPFFQYFGGRAILGPAITTMRLERPEQRDVLTRWMDFHVKQESDRVIRTVGANGNLTRAEAISLHRLQHLRDKEAFLLEQAFDDDIDAVKNAAPVSLKRALNTRPLCSRWKAVLRLLPLGFDAASDPAQPPRGFFLNPPVMPMPDA